MRIRSKFLTLETVVTTETETSECATAEEIGAGEQTAAVEKVPTTKDHSNAEYPLGESAEVNEPDESDATSETVDNNEI